MPPNTNPGFNTEWRDLSDYEWEESFIRYSPDNLGVNSSRMSMYGFEDGGVVYGKDGSINQGAVVNGHIAAYIVFDEIGVDCPEIAYDAEEDVLLVEDVGGRPLNSNPNAVTSSEVAQTIAPRLMVGDLDIEGNILTNTKEYSSSLMNIDFDRAGHTVEQVVEQEWENLNNYLDNFSIRIEDEVMDEEFQRIRGSTDPEKLLTRLESEPYLDDKWPSIRLDLDASIYSIAANFT